MFQVVTYKKSRTTPEIKNILTKGNVTLGNPGSVSRLFDKKGLITLKSDQISEDDLIELAGGAGAEDVLLEEDVFHVTTSPEDYEPVLTAISAKGIQVTESGIKYIPTVKAEVTDQGHAEKVIKILDLLDAHDDVQSVNSNFEPSENLELS